MRHTTLVKAALSATLGLISTAALAQDKAAPAPAPIDQKAPAPAAAMEYCVFHTSKGDIVMELERAKAPVTVDNFVSYIKDGFYDGTVFHRIVPNFVVQGGGFDTKGTQKKTRPPILNEWQNGLKNKRGTLSMARTNDPGSATSQFFISLKDNDMLDQPISGNAGYAVYGRVISGMNIVDDMAKVQRGMKNGMGDWPIQDIVVTKAEMIGKETAEKLSNGKSKEQAKPEGTATPVVPATPAAPATPARPARPPVPKPSAPDQPSV